VGSDAGARRDPTCGRCGVQLTAAAYPADPAVIGPNRRAGSRAVTAENGSAPEAGNFEGRNPIWGFRLQAVAKVSRSPLGVNARTLVLAIGDLWLCRPH